VDIFKPIDIEDGSHWEEVTYTWLPAWAYTQEELREIGKNCIRFDSNGYTMRVWITVTNYFNQPSDIL
jgi:hypothetical protein